MISRILVAIDSHSNDQSIVDAAISLAQSNGADLMLLHVLSEEDPGYPVLPTYAYYSVLKDSDDGLLREKFAKYEQAGIDYLTKLTQKAIAAGIEAEYVQSHGIPGAEICELARDWSADLIMVGSRGLKGLKEMFMGSVSNYVTHHAPCSVLIVRTEINPTSRVSAISEQAKHDLGLTAHDQFTPEAQS